MGKTVRLVIGAIVVLGIVGGIAYVVLFLAPGPGGPAGEATPTTAGGRPIPPQIVRSGEEIAREELYRGISYENVAQFFGDADTDATVVRNGTLTFTWPNDAGEPSLVMTFRESAAISAVYEGDTLFE